MNLRSLLRIGLVLFFLFPFIFLLTQFRISESPDIEELLWAFRNSFSQAFLSALGSLVLGVWASLALLSGSDSGGRRRFLKVMCLFPNFLPPLFILLAALNFLNPFPMGLTGISLVHIVMNFGLVAVLMTETIEVRLGGVTELAYVEGAGRWQFMTQVFLPVLRKDFLHIFLFVFVICFGSFSVPLIVGGIHGTTVEVLIYEKIRMSGDWGAAVVLALLQSVFIFLISFVAFRGPVPALQKITNLSLIKNSSGAVLIIAVMGAIALSYAQGLYRGLTQPIAWTIFTDDLWQATLGTVVLGLSVGICCYLGLLLIAYCSPKSWFERFLTGYVAPSTALACFSVLIVGPNEGVIPFIKIPLAITLLSLSSLYRMGWSTELQALRSQAQISYSMGASSWQIFTEIIFPQVTTRAGFLSGLAAVWACGDYAVSRILAHRDLSLGMMTETLMSGYRLNHAILMSSLIVVVAGLCFAFFVGGSRVLRRKFSP